MLVSWESVESTIIGLFLRDAFASQMSIKGENFKIIFNIAKLDYIRNIRVVTRLKPKN